MGTSACVIPPWRTSAIGGISKDVAEGKSMNSKPGRGEVRPSPWSVLVPKLLRALRVPVPNVAPSLSYGPAARSAELWTLRDRRFLERRRSTKTTMMAMMIANSKPTDTPLAVEIWCEFVLLTDAVEVAEGPPSLGGGSFAPAEG